MEVPELQKFINDLREICLKADNLNGLKEAIFSFTDRYMHFDDFNDTFSDIGCDPATHINSTHHINFGMGYNDELEDVLEEFNKGDLPHSQPFDHVISDSQSDHSEFPSSNKLATTINSQELAKNRMICHSPKRDMSALDLLRSNQSCDTVMISRDTVTLTDETNIQRNRKILDDSDINCSPNLRTNHYYTEHNAWPDSGNESPIHSVSSINSGNSAISSKDSDEGCSTSYTKFDSRSSLFALRLNSPPNDNSPENISAYYRSSSSPNSFDSPTSTPSSREAITCSPVGPKGDNCPILECNCVFTINDSLAFKMQHINNHFD